MNTLVQPWDSASKALLIFEALKNKYQGVRNDHLRTLIDDLVGGQGASDGNHLAAYNQVRQDIACQVRTLRGIEAGASANRPTPVQWLQSLLLGRDLTEDDFRQQSFVDDFGGEPPIGINDIHVALHELELLCSWSIPSARLTPLAGQAALLSHIYSSVIRIHPFRDANGRTARFLVQYALRDWGTALLPLPKVRNDPVWQNSLGKAVAGNLAPLTAEFLRRLAPPLPAH